MEKIIPNNTEVLIFKQIREWGLNQDEEHFIKGVVKSSEESEDLSHHGSPWTVQIYTVLGEDGKIYRGTYMNGLLGDSFFRTIEDHIECLEAKISNNKKIIYKLGMQNAALYKNIIDLNRLKYERINEAYERIYNQEKKDLDNMILGLNRFKK